MTLLVLGGTQQGREFTQALIERDIDVIYSQAGLVRTPMLACEIVSGGFTPLGGLAAFIRERNITAVWDITHPYASVMSQKAVDAATTCGIVCLRITRPEWQMQTGDDWHFVKDWRVLMPKLTRYQRVWITSGQLSDTALELWQLQHQAHPRQQQWLRTAVEPKRPLPNSMVWQKGIGPFSYTEEYQWLTTQGIDCIVTKHSGGDATHAKLDAARALALPVYLFERPIAPVCDKEFMAIDDAIAFAERSAREIKD